MFYRSGDQMMVVGYTVRATFLSPRNPECGWPSWGLAPGPRRFDVAGDGKRLAVSIPVEPVQEPKAADDVVFVLNFLDELRPVCLWGNEPG